MKFPNTNELACAVLNFKKSEPELFSNIKYYFVIYNTSKYYLLGQFESKYERSDVSL